MKKSGERRGRCKNPVTTDPEGIKRFISAIVSAVTNCSLYSRDHNSVLDLTGKALGILNELTAGKEGLELMVVANDLIVNKVPVRHESIHGKTLRRRLRRKGISRIDFLSGISLQELKQFVADLAEGEKGMKPYPHIKAGVVDINTRGIALDAGIDMAKISSLGSEQVERVREAFHDFSPYRKLNVTGLEEIVANYIVAFKREASLLQLISPVRSYSEYTYTHATNVAVLSLCQAEALGAGDELLYDIGIAALLHDVGKLFVPKEIIEKNGVLNDAEWAEIRRHTLYGARYLAKIDDLTRLAPLAAMEHHMRYDGQGYPRLKAAAGRQHLCSQIIAISDFFDALRSRRPYKKDWQAKEVLVLLRMNSGTEFNPVFVDNFLKIMATALNKAQ